MIARGAVAAVIVALIAGAVPVAAANFTICAERIQGEPDDFADEFSRGPIVVPAGTVFEYAGHAFGPASDPLDASHYRKDHSLGWEFSAAENERRLDLQSEDATRIDRPGFALITLSTVRLTKTAICLSTDVAAASSTEWGWTIVPVFGRPDIYFQTYGVMKDGKLDTSFDRDENPFEHAAARGELNGILAGTTARVIHVE